ncbi:MAG TPA: ATP-binding protein [bacterium]|nr:ATP-binding protein [bacterium]
MRKLFQSLSFRIFILMMVIVTCGFGLFARRSVQTHSRELLESTTVSAIRVSDIIQGAMRYGMLINRIEDIHQIINTLAADSGIAAIRLFDKNGTVISSSRREEVGSRLEISAKVCAECHAEGAAVSDLPLARRQRVLQDSAGLRILGVVNPIANEPDCYTAGCHAHTPEERVLGVLDVQWSLTGVDAQLRSDRRQLILFGLLLILGCGLSAGWFIDRFVRRRVQGLIRGTREIAAGHLDYRIEADEEDELGQLAAAFNHMSADLGAARRELTDWSLHLEEKVDTKSRELAEAESRLARMERLASLGQLSATVAHEINNPLAGALNYSYLALRLLQDDSLTQASRERLQEYLTIIKNEVGRSGDIINNMLLFARQSGGHFAEEHLHGLIASSLKLVHHHMVLKGISCHEELNLEDDRLTCDAGQIRQALVALFVNAIEAMVSGGVLTVRTSAYPESAAIGIEVVDTGGGIPTDILPHIFDPFFSTKKEGKGVGLGLAVTFGIIQRHQGQIEVDSSVQEGTTFRILLPREPAVDKGERETSKAPATDSW